MVRVKICGITSIEDAQMAVAAGASALGFIFHKKKSALCFSQQSPARSLRPCRLCDAGGRLCQLQRARGAGYLPPGARCDRPVPRRRVPGYCKRFNHFKIIKAFRVSDVFDFKSVLQYKVDACLFDTFQEETPGGTGKTFNWDLLKNYKFDRPIILSGGLDPENVRRAIEAVHPYAVDVSSGVEKSPGVKGYQLVRHFLLLYDNIHAGYLVSHQKMCYICSEPIKVNPPKGSLWEGETRGHKTIPTFS